MIDQSLITYTTDALERELARREAILARCTHCPHSKHVESCRSTVQDSLRNTNGVGMRPCGCAALVTRPSRDLTKIPIHVNFSPESPRRAGWVTIIDGGDTIVIRQHLERTEQWESDMTQQVYIPRGLLEALFAPTPEGNSHALQATN